MRRFIVQVVCMVSLILTSMIWWRIGVIGYLSGQMSLPDFDAYYWLLQDARIGINPYQVSYMTTAGPPLVLLPWWPFSWLPLNVARATFTALSLLSGALASWILAQHWRPQQAGRLAIIFQLLIWLSFPARFALQMGQWGLVMLLLTSLVLTRSKRMQALALTGLILVKTFFVVAVVGVGSNRKVWQWLLAGLTISLCLSLWLTPLKIYREYWTQRGADYFSETLTLTQTDYYNQSLKSTLARLGIGQIYPWIAGLLFLTLGSIAWRRQDLGLGLLLALCVSPILWQHYLVMMWPFWILLLKRAGRYPTGHRILLLLCTAFIFSEFGEFHHQPLNWLTALAASHQFIGLVTLTLMWWHWRPLYLSHAK